MVGIRGGAEPVDRILVGLYRVAVRIAQGNDAAQSVGVIVVDGIAINHLGHGDGLVDAGTVEVFAQEVSIFRIFGQDVAAVVGVVGNKVVHLLFDAATTRIISVVGSASIRRRHSRNGGSAPLHVVHAAAVIA